MIDGLVAYEDYQDSGQEWLGKIPRHWKLTPGHVAFGNQSVANIGLKEKTVLSLSYGRIKVKPTDKQHGLVPASYETYQIVDKGNIIIRGTDLQNDKTSLRVGLVRDRGIISSAYICLKAKDTISPEYGYEMLNVFDLTKAIYRYGSGLRQNLDFGEIKRLPIFIPPPDEQTAIVKFLQYVNLRLKGFVAAKRKLISLLNEQKSTIVQQAITRGLNPNVSLKPSGIEWLGTIPTHWQVKRLKQVSKIVRGRFSYRPRNDSSLYDGPYPFIQTGSVARAGKFITKYKQTLNEKGLSVSRLFPKGTLCMTIAANIGDVAILDFDACFPDSVVGFFTKPEIERDFLYLIFLCIKSDLLMDAPVNTQGNLNLERLGPKPIPLPEPSEQTAIVKWVEAQTTPIDQAIFRAEHEISLVREFRTRLTADIVTGKLDVREAAAKLTALPSEAFVDDSGDLSGDTLDTEIEDSDE